jgi:hypothetical protein
MPVTIAKAVAPSTVDSVTRGACACQASGRARTQPTIASNAKPCPISSGLSKGSQGSGAASPGVVFATHSQPKR